MKIKKIAITLILMTILIVQFTFIGFNTSAYAAVKTKSAPGFNFIIEAADTNIDLANLHKGSTFDINVKISNMHDVDKGILVIGGTLQYDRNIFEEITRADITGHNGWKITANGFNKTEGIFLAENDERINSDGNFLTIRFKVKNSINVPITTKISMIDTTSSSGNGLIVVNKVELPIGIVEEKEEITSDVYRIKDEYISRILPGTTVEKFKSKVTTNQEMVFTDKAGNTLSNTSLLTTGVKVKVGKTLQYTLVVMGDIDGEIDSQGRVISENDLAKIKLHYIKHTLLQGVELMAADYDDDNGKITVNDIAIIKLIILGEITVNV